MSATSTRLYTVEDLAKLPGDEPWELWDGRLRTVPGSGWEASELGAVIVSLLMAFVRPRRLGSITAADGSYVLYRNPDTVVVPDVAFVRAERIPEGRRPKGYAPLPPDLAVEVQSPYDEPGDIEAKLDRYRRAQVPLVWWVHPDRRTVSVYRDGTLAAELGVADVLDGGDVLPGLALPVTDIFG
jgi:Uma2 family endonuclease